MTIRNFNHLSKSIFLALGISALCLLVLPACKKTPATPQTPTKKAAERPQFQTPTSLLQSVDPLFEAFKLGAPKGFVGTHNTSVIPTSVADLTQPKITSLIVSVTVAAPATGGKDGSSLQNAIPIVMTFQNAAPANIIAAGLSIAEAAVPSNTDVAILKKGSTSDYKSIAPDVVKMKAPVVNVPIYAIGPLNFGTVTTTEKGIESGIQYIVLQPKTNPTDANRRFYILKGKRRAQ